MQASWCVTDETAERLFLCIRDPSLVLVVGLPNLQPLAEFRVPKGGAHGLDIDHARRRLHVACDDNALVNPVAPAKTAPALLRSAGSPRRSPAAPRGSLAPPDKIQTRLRNCQFQS
jgi:hypothetical protein